MRVYLDANIFIYAAIYKGRKADACRKLLKSIVSGENTALTSVLTIDEVVWTIMNHTDRKTALLEARRIFELPNIAVEKVSPEDALSALRYMEKYPHLSPRDAIHLAVALDSGVYTIYTDDSDFDGIEEINRRGL